MAAFRLSASTFTRIEWRITLGMDRMRMPVSPEPVKATTSCGPRCSRMSPALPTSTESAPSGRTAFSTSSSVMRYATRAELVAGLLTTGTPARSATAAFSAKPQAGKLKALMCTATPRRGTAMCCPWKRGVRPSGMPSPSTTKRASPSDWPSCAYEDSVKVAPSTSNLASPRVLPPFLTARSRISSRWAWITSDTALSSAPRSAKDSARSVGPPRERA